MSSCIVLPRFASFCSVWHCIETEFNKTLLCVSSIENSAKSDLFFLKKTTHKIWAVKMHVPFFEKYLPSMSTEKPLVLKFQISRFETPRNCHGTLPLHKTRAEAALIVYRKASFPPIFFSFFLSSSPSELFNTLPIFSLSRSLIASPSWIQPPNLLWSGLFSLLWWCLFLDNDDLELC